MTEENKQNKPGRDRNLFEIAPGLTSGSEDDNGPLSSIGPGPHPACPAFSLGRFEGFSPEGENPGLAPSTCPAGGRRGQRGDGWCASNVIPASCRLFVL